MSEMLDRLMNNPASARKFVVALLGAVLTAVSLGLLPADVENYVAVAASFAAAYGVYIIPNKKEEPLDE